MTSTTVPLSLEEALFREHGKSYSAGHVIFTEGEAGDTVYVVRSGKVQISKAVGERSKILAVLTVGDFFGEMALVSDRPRSATATAVEDSRLLVLGKEMFFRLLRGSYEITVRIISQLSRRLAEADKRLETLLFTDATTRLVKMLEEAEENCIPMQLPELAFELGVVEERVRRITDKLHEKAIISFEANGMVVKDKSKLAKLKNYLTLKEEFGQID